MNWICSQCGEKFSRFRTRCPHEGARVIEDLAGQLIGGRYRVRELIGVGGMDSTVWKAWQTGTERTVAVKVLPVADEASARRFSRGARIAANLNHPNCAVIHDYGKTEDGKLYLVMEFLQGQGLQELIGPVRTHAVPVADTVHVAIQVLQALEHAHAERAVHRDLKPDNLFLTRKNDDPLHVKILDFGIAKYVEEDPTDTSPTAEEKPSDGFEDLVTEQRQVCGTPQYMAPEQVVGARIDQRTDLYSLGCVMYRMLTGRLPFDGKTRYELYQKHLQEAPKPFSDLRPDLVFPERLELIVMKALMKRPDQRFQNASDMRKALETVDVVDGAPRRNNRPRVALKDTSPQSQVGSPAAAPAPQPHLSAAPFTLSQPSPVSVAVTTEAPAPPPLPAALRRDTSPKPLGAAIPPPPLPSVTGLDAAPGRAGTTAVASVEAPAAFLARPATDLLNDAVLRHPASRQISSVVPQPGRVSQAFNASSVPSVPRSTETQPNKSDEARDSRRRKLTVAAILTGAFGVGVGGVALVMKLTQPAEARDGASVLAAQVSAEAPGQVAEPNGVRAPSGPASAEPATETRMGAALASAQKPAGMAPSQADPDAPVAPPRVDPMAAPIAAGRAAGEALALAPIEPAVVVPPAPEPVEVRFESEPAGASVKEGASVLGTTPCALRLAPGKHQITLEREGSKPSALDFDLQSLPGAGPVQKKVVLEPVAAPRPPAQQRHPSIPGLTPTPHPTLPIPPTPREAPPIQAPTGDGTRKPTVKLLDEDDPPPSDEKPGKKPTVKLLDDDDATPPPTQPKVKVLGE